MDRKYLPPHMRNTKKVAPEPAPAAAPSFGESDFPSLSNIEKTSVFDKKEGKSFANMATEWAEHREQQLRAEELKKQESETLEEHRRHYRVTPLPHFHNVRHFVEPEDDDEDVDETATAVVDSNETGWVEVKPKKHRKVKTFEERMARPPTPEDSRDETVWNGTDDDDSYWKR